MKRFIFGLLLSAAAYADGIQVLGPTSVAGSGFSRWSAEFTTRFNALPAGQRQNVGECREITEVPDTILCIVGSIQDVVNFQARASIFAEGAGVAMAGQVVGKGTLVERNSVVFRAYAQSVGGTDIKSDALDRFYEQVQFHCDCSPGCDSTSFCPSANTCLSAPERELYEKVILPAQRRGRPYTVIMSPYEYGIISGHEVLHAQYFGDAAYRSAVDDFWQNGLTPAERASITAQLGNEYDARDELLIRNEFQAYAFMSEGSSFTDLTKRYRIRLINYLQGRGVTPLLLAVGAP